MNSISFFENPWVVSICSGILMYGVTSLFVLLSKKNQDEKNFILSLKKIAKKIFCNPEVVKFLISIVVVMTMFLIISNSQKKKTPSFTIPTEETRVQNGIFKEIEMVLVKGGVFMWSSTKVNMKDYYIGKYEITQEQWSAVMNNNPSFFKGDNLPVENINWNEVQEFITKLNNKTGKNYRLPTEVEWVYAASGGNKSRGYIYSGSNNADDVAWYLKNSHERTQQVGLKSPNELGIHDMSGNVWEWCNECRIIDCSYHIIRGGSWFYSEDGVRVSNGEFIPHYFKSNGIGFRLVHN